MEQEMMQLLYLLDENESNTIDIPSLNLSAPIKDKLSTALLLLPIFKDSIVLDMVFTRSKFVDQKQVLNAYNYIKRMEEKSISIVCIVGNKFELAFQTLNKKLKDYIFEDEIFKISKNEQSIYVPILDHFNISKNMMSLSAMGVTVIHISKKGIFTYAYGQNVSQYRYDMVSFIQFLNRQGFMFNEYLYAELIFCLEKVDVRFKNVILNNLETAFVKSLSEVFESTDFMNESKIYDLNSNNDLEKYESDFNDLIDILKIMDFGNIKEYKFLFVRKYLYDKD